MFKQTPARVAVMDFFNNSKKPVDVVEIIEFLRSEGLKTNKVTVYRIIDTLLEKDILEKVEFGEGKYRFELKKNHHHHLICTECGRVQDVEGDLIDRLEKEIGKDKQFKVQRHTLEFFGLCKSCQELLKTCY